MAHVAGDQIAWGYHFPVHTRFFWYVPPTPTLIVTGDHDDRVVPLHSFKFASALQHAQAGPAPILIRIETRAGHGAGKPLGMAIEEMSDVYAFLLDSLGAES
jgi:prolyl oligopeptidase PreP (S9A serine peptidase family)